MKRTKTSLQINKVPEENYFEALSGYTIDYSSDKWQLDKNYTLRLDELNNCSSDIAEFVRKTLAEHVRNYRAITVYTALNRVVSYLRESPPSPSLSTFLSWKDSISKDRDYSHQSSQIVKRFFIYGYERGIQGIPETFIDELKEYILSESKDVALRSVEKMDPYEGPFSDIELQNILSASLVAYKDNRITLEQYAAITVAAQTGRRPIQLSDLRLGDLLTKKTSYDIEYYELNVPRAKQRAQTFRSQFNTTPIDQDAYLVLNKLKDNIVSETRGFLANRKSWSDDVIPELPFFIKRSRLKLIQSTNDLMSIVKTDRLHMANREVGGLITSAGKQLNVVSERTGEFVNITSKRFRHTIGTNLAREGLGVDVISEALDHTTNVAAGSYVKNTPEIVDRLDASLAMQLAPLAQAFAGVIIRSEDDAIRASDPSSRVGNESGHLGSCGSYGFCGALAPVACYTCNNFQPWLNAPHEQVLQTLIRQRERQIQITGDKTIAAVNDRVILAVTEVVQKCEKMRSRELTNE